MIEPPLVSIIIPCYNAEKYLDETLQSIFLQSYLNIEVILVDDGSTDNSVAVAQKYSGVKIVRHETNCGPCIAVDSGFAAATGEYAAMLAADDCYLFPCTVYEMMHELERGADWCYFSENIVGQTTQGKKDLIRAKWGLHPAFDNLLLRFPNLCLLIMGFRNSVNSSAMMVRLDKVRLHGISWSKWGARTICDGAFIHQMLKAGLRGRAINGIGVFYRQHERQISKEPAFLKKESEAKTWHFRQLARPGNPMWLRIISGLLSAS